MTEDLSPPSNPPSPHQIEMYITQEEMMKEQIPIAYRDYCAHLLPELNKCRIANYYMPWACKMERIAYDKCQYDEF